MATIVRLKKRKRRPEDHPLYKDLVSLALGLDLLKRDVHAAEAAIDAGDDDAWSTRFRC